MLDYTPPVLTGTVTYIFPRPRRAIDFELRTYDTGRAYRVRIAFKNTVPPLGAHVRVTFNTAGTAQVIEELTYHDGVWV